MTTYEQLISDVEEVTAQCQPKGTREGIYDVEVIFNDPNIQSASYPELKQDHHVPGCDFFGFGRNHYYHPGARRSVYYDGENVDVSFNRKNFRGHTFLKNCLDITLRDRRIRVTLNEHSLCPSFEDVLKR